MNIKDIIKDSNRLYIGQDVPKEYQSDMKLYAVAFPKTKEEVINLVKYANENNIVMLVRGAATGVTGAQIPVTGNELIIDMSLMNNIVNLNEETLTLTVEPGVILHKIQEFAESKGYFYPPDPGSKLSSIGGNVSTNAGGMRAVKYGTTRDYVKSLDIVLANGDFMTVGSLNIKNSSGYDLKNLFIGSEGTLGIFTQIKLKLIPLPKYNKSLILSFNDVVDATDTIIQILKQGYEPTALEMFERKAIEYSENFLNLKFQSQKGDAYILLTLDGNDEDYLIKELDALKKDTFGKAIDVVMLETNEDSEKAWKLRDNILYALMEFTQYELLDEVVPINKFAQMVRYTKELQDIYKINILNFGHAGDGNVHTVLMKGNYDSKTWEIKRKELLDDLYHKVYELGGLPSAEHGIGLLKKEYFIKYTDKVKLDFMRNLKKMVDPKGLLNPSKVF